MIFQKLFSDDTQNASLSAQKKYPMLYPNSMTYFQQLLAPFQFIAWLIFQPSAWRRYIQSIDSTLAADFALADLPKHTPELRRLLRFTFLRQPLLVGVLVGLVLLFIKFFLWFVGSLPAMLEELMEIHLLPNISELHSLISVESLILGVSYGIVLSFVGSTIASFTISMAYGIVVGVLGGLSAGILFGLVGTKTIAGLWLGLFIVSLAGSVTASLHAHRENRTWKWQIGGIIIGLTVSAVVLLIGFMLGSGFGHLVTQLPFINLTLPQAQIIGMAAAVGLILGWRQDARWMATLAFFFASAIWLLISLIFNVVQVEQTLWLRRLLSGITGGAANGILFTLLFSVPYMMTRYIAGAWAGVVAGILGSGGTYLGFALFIAPDQVWLLLGGGLLSVGLGLSYQWWLPVVMYPLTAAWNLSLHLSQKRQPKLSAALLLRHSAFWDEHQYLRLWGLEKQLVALSNQDEAAAKLAMNHLLAGHQSWAVQSAQLELDWQRLEQCREMTEIANVHQALLSTDPLSGTAGKWLNHFREMSLNVDAALSQHSQYQQHAKLSEVIGFLSGLLIDGERRATEVQRFITIAASWKTLMDDYADKLLNKLAIPNPYTYGQPLDRKYHPAFAERLDVLQPIEQLLQQHLCPPLLLYGQRRIGKTTLLMNMNTMLPSNFIMLFVDFQGPICTSLDHAGFFHNLGRALLQSAEHYPDLKLPPLDKQTLMDDPVAGFDEWLYQVEKAAADKIFLLAMDEFVTIDDNCFETKRLEPEAILGMFRHIIQHRPRIRLLFAGTHTFAELEQWASYFINAKTVHMSYLSDQEAHRLIEEPVKSFPLRYTPEASQRVVTVTRKHPGLIQLLCREIVDIKDKQTPDKRLQVQVDEVDTAIASAIKYGSMFFTDIEQNQVGEIGPTVLHFMASQGEGAVVNRPDLEAQFPSSDLTATLELLVRREIIEEKDSGYRFQIEMVRRWFAVRTSTK